MKWLRPIAALALLLGFAPPASAAGAWQTLLRPQQFTDVLAEGDTLWCASRDGGLWRFTSADHAFFSYTREPGGLLSNQILALAMDTRHRLWVGTLGRGMGMLSADRTRWDLVNVFDGLPSDTVTVIESQGDTLWIGTASGLALWDGSQIAGRLPDGVNPSPFASNDVRGIGVVGDSVWVGTSSGAYVARKSQGLATWTRVVTGFRLQPLQSLASDGASVFAISRDSLHVLDVPGNRWVVLTGIGQARALSVDSGQAFASMSGGIYEWNGASWVLLNVALRAPVGDRFVMTRDGGGRIWAAGRPATAVDQRATGLYGEVSGGAPWEFFYPPGPPGNDILNVEVEGGRVYVTTFSTGIGRLDATGWTHWVQGAAPSSSPNELRRPVYNYSAAADRQGRVWFGSWAPVDFGSNCAHDTGAVEIMRDLGATQEITRQVWGGSENGLHSFTRGATVGLDSVMYFGLDSPCGEVPEFTPLGIDYYAPDGTLLGTLGIDEGMPSTQVWSLATSDDGRIWAGTSRGFVQFRHDASGVGTIKPVSDASTLVVRGLATYGDTLWALTNTGGLRRYSIAPSLGADGIDFRSFFDAAPAALQSVRPVDVAADGSVWVGTTNGITVHRARSSELFTIANSPLAADDVRSVRVDRSTGYVWIATAGGLSRYDPHYVPPPPPTLPALQMAVYPNPARLTAIGFGLRLAGNGTTYRGAIFDLNGRRVHKFQARSNGGVIWNGRDESGTLVRPGIYFLNVESGGQTASSRIVVVR